MKPTLYQYAACPFCSKVAAMLSLKRVSFDTVEVHPLNKKEIAFSKEYRAVPIYVDSHGTQVNDSTPILRHIDREFPEPAVFSKDEAAKAEEERWLTWSEDYVQGLPTVVYGDLGSSLKAFDYVTKVGKFSWAQRIVIKYSGAFVMTLVAKKIKKRLGITDPVVFLRAKVSEWAVALNGRPFLGGTKPNGADVAVYGISRIVSGLKAGKLFSENAAFDAWMRRMAETTRLDFARAV